VLPVAQGTNCSVGQPKRGSYALIDQLEATGAPVMLLLPEVAYDQASSAAGLFSRPGGWYNFLEELLSESLAPILGERHVSDIGRIVVFSHSGAYLVTGYIATIGNVSQVREVVLFDSLYGAFQMFDQFVKNHLAQLGNQPTQYRFSNVYTDHGGTYNNSLNMEVQVAKWLKAAGKSSYLLFDNTYSTLPPAAYLTPVIFKRSMLAHDSVPTYYFKQFVTASPFFF